VAFEDVRIPPPEWPAHKPKTPFGSIPVLEVEGLGELAQSVAILTYIGRSHGLHPSDPWQAARHEALMMAGEELRSMLAPKGLGKASEDQKATREALAAGPIPRWAAAIDKQVEGPFVAGEALNVVDIKLYMLIKWLRSGVIDFLPTTLVDPHPKLIALHDAFVAHPKVREWQSRS
jgi:glutathione S-transferase